MGWPLHDIAITNILCCMANQQRAAGNHILRIIDCKIQQGGCNKGGVECHEYY